MRAGELRHRVTIQRNDPTRDTFNAEVDSWNVVDTVWAKVETPTGSQYADWNRDGASLTHKVTIRDRADITPTMRLVWGVHILALAAPPLRDNLKRECVLLCSEVVDD